MIQADSADTPEMKAFRGGKAAGYSVGVIDGWDACMRHVQNAFDAAIVAALKEPAAVTRHREVQRDRDRPAVRGEEGVI